jgi:hypothetical protein
MLRRTGMLSGSYTVVVTPQFQWRTKRGHVSSTRPNFLKSVRKWISMLTSKTNNGNPISNTKMQLHLLNPRLVTLPYKHGGSPPGPQQSKDYINRRTDWHFGTLNIANKMDLCNWCEVKLTSQVRQGFFLTKFNPTIQNQNLLLNFYFLSNDFKIFFPIFCNLNSI